MRYRLWLPALLVLIVCSFARAQDEYFREPAADLRILEGEWPESRGWGQFELRGVLTPVARLDGKGEVFVGRTGDNWAPISRENAEIVARIPRGEPLTGSLLVPNADSTGYTTLRFVLARTSESRREFFVAKASYYDALRATNGPGTAYYRWQADQAHAVLEAEFGVKPDPQQQRGQAPELGDTYDLFTGGQAVSENLQLNRDITAAQNPAPPASQDLVAISSVQGLTVRAMDWKKLLGDSTPALDPLAAMIPADQYAVFIPSFDALLTLARETDEQGLPVFRGFNPRGEDGGLIARYERQLCVSRSGLAKLLGPKLIRSIAMTGSDPYFPTGTGVAILFQADNAASLRDLLVTQARLGTGSAAAKESTGEVAGVTYTAFTTPDRRISAYFAALGDTVVAANSIEQLERLASVRGGAPALASLEEYRFFRARYPIGADGETAFLMVSDPAIRRWCSPAWRIGASRRLRAGAVLADLTAAHLDAIAAGVAQTSPIRGDVPMRTIGELSLTPGGVRSSMYNTLSFITPIAELDLAQVTKDEAASYGRWRDTYQRNWSWAFDPIAASLSIRDNRLAADISVMPLIIATQYGGWFSFTEGAAIAPGAGDPHDAIAHLVTAVNPESRALKQAGGFASGMAPGIGMDPLGWLGQSVAIFADPDPFWDQMLGAKDPSEFLEENFIRLPVAIRAEVSSSLKLAAFLTAARTFIEQASPGMLAWDNQSHREQPYVRVGLTEKARAEGGGGTFDQAALFYAAMPRALIISMNEDVVKRAIEREQARAALKDPPATPNRPWLGESMALQVSRAGLDLVNSPGKSTIRTQLRATSWSNLIILNEWKRLFPDRDPVELHQSLWGVRLVCPGGGRYVWDEAHRTMSSTVFGSPVAPSDAPAGPDPLATIEAGNFGGTFEHNGLRARAVIDRTPPK